MKTQWMTWHALNIWEEWHLVVSRSSSVLCDTNPTLEKKPGGEGEVCRANETPIFIEFGVKFGETGGGGETEGSNRGCIGNKI